MDKFDMAQTDKEMLDKFDKQASPEQEIVAEVMEYLLGLPFRRALLLADKLHQQVYPKLKNR